MFLRALEYYSVSPRTRFENALPAANRVQGILFLTTNRVGKIDAAFKSRIHLSLYYQKLNKERTLKIWDNNLRRVKDEFSKEKKDILFEKSEILEFAEDHYEGLRRSRTLGVWNGR